MRERVMAALVSHYDWPSKLRLDSQRPLMIAPSLRKLRSN